MTTGMPCRRGQKCPQRRYPCASVSISAIPKPSSFFHLRDVAPLPDDFPVSAFTLRLHFNPGPLPADIKLRQDSLRLHCTPAINPFTHYAEPVRPDGRMAEYRCAPAMGTRTPMTFFRSVQSPVKSKCQGLIPAPAARCVWPEFESFQHQMEYSRQREVVYWHHRLKRPCFTTGLNIVSPLSMQTVAFRTAHLFNDDVITTSLICTNRRIPARLHTGDICVAVNKNPAVASFRNVTRPTLPLWPVTDGDMHWSLISAMNLNYLPRWTGRH